MALFDAIGRLVWSKEGPLRDGEEVYIGHLPDGVYFARLQSERQMLARKVILRED